MGMSGMVPARADVEVLLISTDDEGRLRYRRVEGRLYADDANVDDVVLNLVGIHGGGQGVWSHSTSWHRNDIGNVVLTYALLPDPDPDLGVLRMIPDTGEMPKRDSDHPTPDVLSSDEVARHAVSHLSFILKFGTNQHVPKLPENLLRALRRRAPGTAGQIIP